MEKKQLNGNSIKQSPDLQNIKSVGVLEWWLDKNGFTVRTEREKVDGQTIIKYIWVRKEEVSDENKNFHDSEEEPSLREILLRVGQQCGTREQPVTLDAYNTFARWDVWPGGYVENLGYVSTPLASVDYGCSIFTNSWRGRGTVENPVHVFQFYRLREENRWRGGEVSTWGNVSGSTVILGNSSSTGFESVIEGQETIGSLVNVGRVLGRDFSVGSLLNEFRDCYNKDTQTYEVSDLRLRSYMQKYFYLYYVYENKDMANVKKALIEHKAVYVRIVTKETNVGDIYGNDMIILDYNWLRQTFVCVNPLNKRLTAISELELMSGTPKALFYILSKD